MVVLMGGARGVRSNFTYTSITYRIRTSFGRWMYVVEFTPDFKGVSLTIIVSGLAPLEVRAMPQHLDAPPSCYAH